MIRMTTGATRIGRRVMTPADGWFIAPPEAEKRLVALGVAELDAGDPGDAVATLSDGDSETALGENPPETEDGAEGAETARLDPEQLKELTNGKLRELAEEIGVDVSKLRTKAQLIEALVSVEIRAGEDDDPPELSPEAPVV